VKFIVPYPAGGVSDVSSRAIAAALGNKLGATMVIENRAGAASTVASTYVASQKPNGIRFMPLQFLSLLIQHCKVR
jgi:tripartite-type tricarboxylate transporter receptor subunit TctC